MMHAGAVIGGSYRLVRPVGKGGMGTVWAAMHESTRQPVAIKLLTTGASEEMQTRLVREAGAAGRLENRHVVDILDVGKTDSGEPFLVMELLQGQTLRSVIKRQRRLDPKLAATVARDICIALKAAHDADIVHRDLKPSNVVLHETPDGIVLKVLDFGVSKVLSEEQQLITSTGIAVGSPAYMSPEQARGARVDHRADLWSIGVLLFEMIAGRRPFAAESPAAMLSMILFSDIPKVSQFSATLDKGLEAVISRCLQRKVSERYQDASEIIAALEPFVLPEIVVEAPTKAQRRDRSESTASGAVATNEVTGSASQLSVPSTSTSSSMSSPSGHVTTASTSHSTTHGVAVTPASHLRVPVVRTPSKTQTRLQWVAACLAILLLGAVSALVLMRATRGEAPPPVAAPTVDQPRDRVTAGPAVNKPSGPEPVPTAKLVETAPPEPEPPPDPEPESDKQPVAKETKPVAKEAKPAGKPSSASATTKPTTSRPTPKSGGSTKKPCASPIVDANGKVVGCL